MLWWVIGGALFCLTCLAVATYFWVIGSTVDGEADPYQSSPLGRR